MIKIEKGREPQKLVEYRQESYATYAGMSSVKTGRTMLNGDSETLHDLVLESLAKEQGYLCAYCMCRIETKNTKKKGPYATIEHIDPQSQTSEAKKLDYRNMLAVCYGNEGGSELTCDKKRGNSELSLNPLQSHTLQKIRYRSSGAIYSEDDKQDSELNDVLNLNSTARDYKHKRRMVLTKLILEINKNGWSENKEQYRLLLGNYNRKQQKKDEYIGVVIDWLKRHI